MKRAVGVVTRVLPIPQPTLMVGPLSSARLGETVYEFWPRTIVGGVRNAWRLERVRLTRRGGSPWTLRNDVLSAWALSAVLWAGLLLAFGAGLLPYLVLQAVVGVLLLESVNYLEHYGLR